MKSKQSNNNEILGTFPSPKNVVRLKMMECELAIQEKEREIRAQLQRLYAAKTDPFSEWFVERAIEILMMPEIEKLKKNIFRLEGFWRLLNLEDGMKKRIETEEKIERAIKFPIQNLFEDKIGPEKFGEGATCPFCNGENYSLHILQETNTFYCTSCQKEGDVITLIMELHGLDFREAVEALQNQDE